MFATQWAVGQVFLMTFAFFLFMLWVWLLVRIAIDIFSRSEISGWGKALWLFVLLVFPFISVVAYLAVHGAGSVSGPMTALAPSDEAIQRQLGAAH